MLQLIPIILGLVAQLAPSAATGVIVKVIDALTQIIPVLVKEAQDLIPIVRNIIAALRANPETIPAQLDALDELERKIDADFDAAAAAAVQADAQQESN